MKNNKNDSTHVLLLPYFSFIFFNNLLRLIGTYLDIFKTISILKLENDCN